MQFLASNHSGAPPVYVRGSLGDGGVLGGISTRSGHMGARSDCLNAMMGLFGAQKRREAYVADWRRSTLGGRGAGAAPALAEDAVLDVAAGAGILVPSRFVAGRAGSWLANQPATWMEFFAADLPVGVPTQVVLLLAAAALALKGALAAKRAVVCGLRAGDRHSSLLCEDASERRHLKA